jgi:predicted CoA-binding protein
MVWHKAGLYDTNTGSKSKVFSMSTAKKTTLVLGASTNPSRYSNLAINRLKNNQFPVVAIGKKAGTVAGIPVIN